MSGIANWFGWSTTGVPQDELPFIFPLGFKEEVFIEIDCIQIYQKILIDVLERTHGIKEEQEPLFYDNCLKSESNKGLIHLLAKAMAFRHDLFLVYDKALNLLRIATPEEQKAIRDDYEKSAKSPTGVYISFNHFYRSDLVRLYSALEYVTIASLNKTMRLSTAIQMKMNDLRQSTGLIDSSGVKTQAQAIAKGLAGGRDVVLDGKDEIETAVPDLTSVKASIDYLSEKRAFYLGLPKSYLCGEQAPSLGDTGEGDTKATERGLKNYYQSIIKPVLEAIFGWNLTYKSQDFRQIDQGLNALKIFSLTDDELISVDNKTLIVNQLFDFDEDAKGSGVKEPDPVPVIVQGGGGNQPPPGNKPAAKP